MVWGGIRDQRGNDSVPLDVYPNFQLMYLQPFENCDSILKKVPFDEKRSQPKFRFDEIPGSGTAWYVNSDENEFFFPYFANMLYL